MCVWGGRGSGNNFRKMLEILALCQTAAACNTHVHMQRIAGCQGSGNEQVVG